MSQNAFNYPGNIVVISGPSGAGKGTLIQQLCTTYFPHAKLAISATTRSPRVGEINHTSYHFLNESSFQRSIQNNDFLEWCLVHEHYYGTLTSELSPALSPDGLVLLEIDVQGAKKIKEKIPSVVTIFIAPPDMATLKERLLLRNTDTRETIEKRLVIAQKEMASQNWYDYVMINNTVEESIRLLTTFISHHFR